MSTLIYFFEGYDSSCMHGSMTLQVCILYTTEGCACLFFSQAYSHTGGGLGGPLLRIMEMMGNKKAAVFPEPVCAHAIRSLCAIMIGTAYFCTGVGFMYCANYRRKQMINNKLYISCYSS